MTADVITLFIKIFVMNMCVYYSTNKIIKSKLNLAETGGFCVINLISSGIYTILNPNMNTLLLIVALYFVYAILLAGITKNKLGVVLLAVLISYAISSIMLLAGTLIGFAAYKLLSGENKVLGMFINSIAQFVLVVAFYKYKRFKNGIGNIYDKFNKGVVDSIVVYVSISLVLVTCLLGSLFDDKFERVANTFITFIILGITMYIMLQRTITMQYRHSLLLKTLDEYKEEIASKDKEIEKLSAEKFNTSKIRHEFYNRQKALELMVKQNMNGNVDKTGVSDNILNIVNELTSEYSKECEIIKGLNSLPKTNIIEIDNMFKYMQTECAKNNIDFKLNIQDSLEPLINNYISKSRLETLLGDHIRDAINAVNKSEKSNKEIMVVLGLKDGVYEICILDNGVEFTIDTLLKLGKEQVTTGGTGIGFLTTFETLKETKASLVITELQGLEYTKSVAFVFNNKCEYVIDSYRADEIKKLNNREDIIINENEG